MVGAHLNFFNAEYIILFSERANHFELFAVVRQVLTVLDTRLLSDMSDDACLIAHNAPTGLVCYVIYGCAAAATYSTTRNEEVLYEYYQYSNPYLR